MHPGRHPGVARLGTFVHTKLLGGEIRFCVFLAEPARLFAPGFKKQPSDFEDVVFCRNVTLPKRCGFFCGSQNVRDAIRVAAYRDLRGKNVEVGGGIRRVTREPCQGENRRGTHDHREHDPQASCCDSRHKCSKGPRNLGRIIHRRVEERKKMRGSPRERTLVPRGIWQEIVVLLRRCRGGGFGVAPPPGVRKKSAHPWVSSLHSSGAEDSRPDGTQRGDRTHESSDII